MLLQSIIDTASKAEAEPTMVRNEDVFMPDEGTDLGRLALTEDSADVEFQGATCRNGRSQKPD